MSADRFAEALRDAHRFATSAEGHLENHHQVRSFDPQDASIEYQLALEDLRIAKAHLARAERLAPAAKGGRRG